MKSIHLVVPDLLLPKPIAQEVCKGLSLPGLEKWLGKAEANPAHADTLEAWLCQAFGLDELAIAPVTLRADGMNPESKYWLRADPVHLSLQRDKMIVLSDTNANREEAAQLIAVLNQHFAEVGLCFHAAHPQRWYVSLEVTPAVRMTSLGQVTGQDAKHFLPQGSDALRWHRVFNEAQMLLYEHPVNQAREARGELAINSLWFWGGGSAAAMTHDFAQACGESDLLRAFAHVAAIEHRHQLPEVWPEGDTLCVWDGLSVAIQRGDWYAWRESLQSLELTWLQSMLQRLAAGDVDRLILHVPRAQNFTLSRDMLWKFWRRPRALPHFSLM